MNLSNARGFASQPYGVMAIVCITLLSFGNSVMLGQQTAQPTAAPAAEAPKIPNDQLDSLVAPIALYPDPLLAQTLAASTYPLEIIQLEQWMKKNKNLKDKALADAVEKQNWDPSVQAMAVFPDVVKQLAENVAWASDLGNAFLAQQADVMDAVQRMRAKAQAAGNLKASQQQKVETKTVQSKTVIVIEQTNPQVVYVPAYNPTVVYGAPAYPYPPIAYPPGYGMLAFGAGVAIGAAWGNGGWGYSCGWGSNNDITINNGNKYVNNSNNINNANRPSGGNSNKWQHSAQHRGSAPYGNKATANKYGGAARQQPAGGTGTMAAGNRPSGGASNMAAGNRPSGGASNMAASRPSGGGANHIGNQSLGGGSSSRGGGGGSPNLSSKGGGFGGGGSASASRASSSRGGSSMGGGGFSRGGGGGGGGHRGGGGGRRR